MGLLDSLAQILPYAIPAAAGAALGGPGLAMVGAGGAAQAQNQNLNKQIEIANLLNESQYRNADLGLRRQEIQSNEALRKQSLQQSGTEHQQAIDEKYDALKLHDQEQQQIDRRDREFHYDMEHDRELQRAQMQQFQQATDRRDRDMLQARMRETTQGQINRAIDKLKEKADKDWKHEPVKERALAMFGLGKDADFNDWQKQYLKKHLPEVLKLSGVTPQMMAQQGFDPETIQDNFPNYNPMPAPTAAAAPAAPSAGSAAPSIPPGSKPVYAADGKLIGYKHD